MKKQTKLEKRRKTVLGAVLGFGAVALLTTATATWIISVNQLTDNGEVSVTVDTVQNNAITLEVGTASIKLAETKAISGDHLVVTSDGLGNLTATFDSIKLTCGKSVIDNNENITINTSISYDGGANALNLADDEDDVTNTRNPSADGLPYTVNGAHWTYVDLVTENITIPTAGSSENDDGSYTVSASGENLKVVFDWGSFFNKKSPANYYNSIFKNGGDASLSQATVEDAANIESELTAMHTALNGHSITVTFEVVLPGAGA